MLHTVNLQAQDMLIAACHKGAKWILMSCSLNVDLYIYVTPTEIEILDMNFSVSENMNNHVLNCLSKIPQPYCQTGAVKWQYGNWKWREYLWNACTYANTSSNCEVVSISYIFFTHPVLLFFLGTISKDVHLTMFCLTWKEN